MIQSVVDKIFSIAQAHGISFIYVVAVWGIIISLSYYKDLKNWENVINWKKGIIVTTLFGTAVLVLMSILGLFGVVNW